MRARFSLEQLKDLLARELEQGVFSHYGFCVGRLSDPEPALKLSSYEKELNFDLASLSKALVTTPLVHAYFENHLETNLDHLNFAEGSFSHEFVEKYPEFCSTHNLMHLLSHTSSLRPWANLWVMCEEYPFSAKKRFLNLFDSYQNGNKGVYQYSDLGFILLGFFLEDSQGMSLDLLFDHFMNSRLSGSCSLGFSSRQKVNSVSTGFCKIRSRELQGEVHDENCFSLGQVSGHCGLFGSLNGVASFLYFFFNSSEGRKFQENLDSLAPKYGGRVGWDIGTGTAFDFANGSSIGHLGFTGTSFWVDLATGYYHVFLTNRVKSSRVNPEFKHTRAAAAAAAQFVIENDQL